MSPEAHVLNTWPLGCDTIGRWWHLQEVGPSGRSSSQWGGTLEGYSGTTAPSSSFFCFPTLSTMMCCTKSNMDWNLQICEQNKPFLFLSCLRYLLKKQKTDTESRVLMKTVLKLQSGSALWGNRERTGSLSETYQLTQYEWLEPSIPGHVWFGWKALLKNLVFKISVIPTFILSNIHE
jgi:hypothetical protein